MNKCQAETYCKSYPAKCDRYCVGYVQMYNIYSMSNIPVRYQYEIPLTKPGKDQDVYLSLAEYRRNVLANVRSGRGLFLYGKCKGNGKTTWACKIMNEYFRHVALKNNLRCRGLFVSVPQFLQSIRDSMDSKDLSIHDFMDNILSADLVIWDDIGAEKSSEWVRERLLSFINYREANGRCQIYTSNLPLTELVLDECLGERVVSRIKGQCHILEFKGADRRGVCE